MNEKSDPGTAFYSPTGRTVEGHEAFDSASTTAGPWTSLAQHGGPPSALLTRAIEGLPEARDRVIGRITVELWGPVPVGPLTTVARVIRPGRSVALAESELYDASAERVVATARAWLLPDHNGGPGVDRPPSHTQADGVLRPRPANWNGGYLDAIDWRWIRGGLEEPGTGVAWMRSPALVEGEAISPLQRVLTCVDSASGISAALDLSDWAFLNTELTVHVLRPPVGEWVCVDAETTLGTGAVGICTSSVHDEQGLVARSAQTLLVVRR